MALTPEDVRNKQFTTVRFKEGYDLDEVDNFLDEVEDALTEVTKEAADLRASAKGEVPDSIRQEIRDLTDENAALKSELEVAANNAAAAQAHANNLEASAAVAGDDSKSAARISELETEIASSQRAANEMEARIAELTAENAKLAEAASVAPIVTEIPAAEQGVASVRILELAQRTADEAVASARIESEQLVADAKTNIANMTREFEAQRVAMERRVEELRAYEREYRSRLRSYLEGQLRELESKNIADARQVTGE